MLAREVDIRRFLIICPASLKSQWRNEIFRFCDRSCQLITGGGKERVDQYHNDAFFTICNYEQVMRDLATVESVPWDLIVLDEVSASKNWESKTSQMIRSLRSPFAIVLSGTPLENRLDELFTVVQLSMTACSVLHIGFSIETVKSMSEANRSVYQRLDELRELLKPILLRRRRNDVLQQLPERTDEIIRIAPTAEQLESAMLNSRWPHVLPPRSSLPKWICYAYKKRYCSHGWQPTAHS